MSAVKNDALSNPSAIQAEHCVILHAEVPSHSLLRTQLSDYRVNYEDHFTLTIPASALGVPAREASHLLHLLLNGFLDTRPVGVTWLMRIRNVLVKPFGLRTSPLGCPVSSLLTDQSSLKFIGRYPVLAKDIPRDSQSAQVILGADDRHLVFRTCVAVRLLPDTMVEFSMGTRVASKNWFGTLYMAAIAKVHREYVSPAMLRHAVKSVRAWLGQ